MLGVGEGDAGEDMEYVLSIWDMLEDCSSSIEYVVCFWRIGEDGLAALE